MKKTIIFLFIGIAIIFNHLKAQNMITHLDKRQQKIVTIAANTAMGNLEQLKQELNAGLDAGLTINEIKEILVQMYAYAGFPRSLQGINTFISVLEERKLTEITDDRGKEATPVTDKTDKYERGKKVLETLTQTSETEPKTGFAAFSPEIDIFLKEHLFADIFGRNVLSYQDRELATISALMAMKGLEPMLQSHINMGMNTGITEAQIKETASLIETPVSSLVRLAKLRIDATQLENYVAVLKEEIETSVRVEPGVLNLYAVSEEENPAHITIMEIYANEDAYKSHLETPHFKKYKSSTNVMVKSLELVETVPIVLGAKTNESIFPKGGKGSADWFTGTVWVQPLVNPSDMENLYSVGSVTFEPGGRTHWHTHPIGQVLLVTEGKGWYQERGKPAQLLTKGSIVTIPKDVEHWHGSAKDSRLVHIAISNMTNGNNVTWMSPVTDEEYNTNL
jgi:quercetin dioxygenase-like cupin family protein/alkylhydroperoxidase/carboxymuconolactone decarboxylase family protein YurZ/quinol monooxygenase YgiN